MLVERDEVAEPAGVRVGADDTNSALASIVRSSPCGVGEDEPLERLVAEQLAQLAVATTSMLGCADASAR